jgi:PTH2 family peptidyl-tRNA hydrolase
MIFCIGENMYKQVIVVRSDIKMSLGKTAAQIAHASLSSCKKADKKVLEKWEREGAKKVVLKVNTLKELLEIYEKVKKEKISCFLVRDAGKTQLKPGTVTCLGVGPDKEDKIDKITKHLKLL